MVSFYFIKNRKYAALPSPGLCLPLVGHIYKLITDEAKKDPVKSLWNLWKKYQRNGMMHFRLFNLDVVYVGDFDTLKYIYNHPECQERLIENIIEVRKEERMLKSRDVTGVIMSEGKIWSEQRRFTLRTLRDFGFGKIGKLLLHQNIFATQDWVAFMSQPYWVEVKVEVELRLI